MLAGAVVLTAPRVTAFPEYAALSQSLSTLVWATLLLAIGIGGWVSLTAVRDPLVLPARPSLVGILVRTATVLAVLALVWATFPTRHLTLAVNNGRYPMFPDAVTELWAGVCLTALGTTLVLCSGWVLSWRRWKRVMAGLVAGALATVLLWTLIPAAVTRLLLVEHTVATVGEAPPVPAALSRVGWTWQPEHPVRGVERGSHGPLVRYNDGFVALHGSTGEELWAYRLPYARQVKTGVFAGQDRYAYLLHAAEPGPEPETQTMVVLDTATGQVVRDAPLPPLPGKDEKDPARVHYLTPDVRVLRVYEDRADRVVAHATDSAAPVWEFEWEATAEDRLCLWGNDGGVRGYGDRVLVSRLCLDRPEVSGAELDAALANMDVPSDAVESLVALDTTTGEQVWRQDWTPNDLRTSSPGVSASREASGGGPVAVTSDGVFALTDGEPVQALPPTSEEATDRILALDSAGAVVLREDAHEESVLLLTDAGGQVVQRRAIDKSLGLWWGLPSASVLGEALVVPYTSYRFGEQRNRALAFMPLRNGEADEWTPIGFGDEDSAEHIHTFDEDAHQALIVPGAVVSYIQVSDGARLTSAPFYGLVP